MLTAGVLLGTLALMGSGGLLLLAALFFWLEELIGRTAALAWLGVVCLTFGGLGLWTIQRRIR